GRLTYAQLIGGKVHTRSASTQVSYCQFTENAGAALTIEGSNPTVEDSLFRRNVVGIRVIRQAAPDVMNNTLMGNVYGLVCDDGGQPTVDRNVIANNREDGILSRGASSPQIQNNNIMRNGGYAVKDGGRLLDNFIQGNNGLPPTVVEISLSPQASQIFGVEEVISTRSSPNSEAGERRFR
ncbi:right-handed parallel beta-helix repeat-containing protein, partial [Candidatus Poribacteria bacterium]|nr:right-handed parallel beta-helix repeat-containing protein [Candidatus Poribacteria bacterium]